MIPRTSPHSEPRCRHGFTVVEAVTACVLLGLLFMALVPVLSRVQRVQAEVDQQSYALEQLRNLVERGMHLGETERHLSAESQEYLPGAKLQSTTVEEPTGGERVTLTLDWECEPGRPRSNVTLQYWHPPAIGGTP